jgi:hypothetical protein
MISKFSNVGLDATNLVALSGKDIASNVNCMFTLIYHFYFILTNVSCFTGAHTFGEAQCVSLSDSLYNFQSTENPDPTLDVTYLEMLRQTCPQGGDANTLANLDQAMANDFDNNYKVIKSCFDNLTQLTL